MTSEPPLTSSPPPPMSRTPSPPTVPSAPPPPFVHSAPYPWTPLYEPPPGQLASSQSTVSVGLIAGVAAGSVVIVAILIGTLFLIFRRSSGLRDMYESFYGFNRPSRSPSLAERNIPDQIQIIIIHSPLPLSSSPSRNAPDVEGGTFNFKYEELQSGTEGFSESKVLSRGRLGCVYHGTVLNGKEVAIKKLKSGGGQSDEEFRAEIMKISQVHHQNLVSLVGYCIHKNRRFLVYEFVPNKTLDFHLHGSGRPTFDWYRRWKVALGCAKGLAYLHDECDPKVIHRDIKAANILLDYNFEPKIAGFRLAKLVPTDMSHVSTRVMGTFGYVAPEYATSGKLTDRSDVYSYGVVLLELITGRKPIMGSDSDMDQSLVNWARPLLARAIAEEIYDELIDPRLETNYDQHDMTRLMHCAAVAVRTKARKRPRMVQIVRYLEGKISLEDLKSGEMMPNDREAKRNSAQQDQAPLKNIYGMISHV